MKKRQAAIIRKDDLYVCAVLEDQDLDDVIVDEMGDDSLKTGEIYICKVSHVVKNINAAFVEVKKNVMCYLPLKEPGMGADKVCAGMEFPVQVKKAAVKSKQAVVSRKLEFSGKYAVITTVNLTKNISAKITSQEKRAELGEILDEFKDSAYGIILRTSCEKAERQAIEKECRTLLSEAESVIKTAESRTCFSRVYCSPMEFVKYLRDCKNGNFDRIITDDGECFRLLTDSGYFSGENLVFYEDPSYPLDKLLGITSKLKKVLSKHVWLKSGGSLVIEPTEALTVIDVNTEKAIAGKRNSETTFFKINMEAAKEAARQIRIRNLSGIILIDFIDMKEKEHIRLLLHELENEFRKDSVRTTVVDITKLGLVEITRMKMRKPLSAFFVKSKSTCLK